MLGRLVSWQEKRRTSVRPIGLPVIAPRSRSFIDFLATRDRIVLASSLTLRILSSLSREKAHAEAKIRERQRRRCWLCDRKIHLAATRREVVCEDFRRSRRGRDDKERIRGRSGCLVLTRAGFPQPDFGERHCSKNCRSSDSRDRQSFTRPATIELPIEGGTRYILAITKLAKQTLLHWQKI